MSKPDYAQIIRDRSQISEKEFGPEIFLERITKEQQHKALLMVKEARDRLSKRTKAWKLLDKVARLLGETVTNRMYRDLMKKLCAPDAVTDLQKPPPIFGLLDVVGAKEKP